MQAVLLGAWCLAPAVWMLLASFRDLGSIYEVTPIPTSPTFANYLQAIQPAGLLGLGLVNSTVISASTTLLVLLLGASAAYVLARLEFAGKGIITGGLLALAVVPGAVILPGLFLVWTGLHVMYSIPAVVVSDLALTMPLAVYTLGFFFRDLPWDLEDAALVDGCTRSQAFRRVMLPLAAPAVVTTAMLTFIATWNEYLLATILTNEKSTTVTVVIGDLAAELTGTGATMAAGVIATAPIVVLALVFQRRIVNGLMAGAVKG